MQTDCVNSLPCNDYFFQNLKGWNYLINNLNNNIKVYRIPKMSKTSTLYYKPSMNEIYTIGDLLIAVIGYRNFSTDFLDANFFDSVMLNNVQYKNVYEKTFINSYAEPIYVRKVYFNKGLGLIGYELSNNEVWNLNIK